MFPELFHAALPAHVRVEDLFDRQAHAHEGKHRKENPYSRRDDGPPLTKQDGTAALCIGKHFSPADSSRVSKPEEAEARLRNHDAGAGQRSTHDNQVGYAGQNVPEHDISLSRAGKLRCLYIIVIFYLQYLRTDGSGQSRPAEQDKD